MTFWSVFLGVLSGIVAGVIINLVVVLLIKRNSQKLFGGVIRYCCWSYY